MEYQKAKLYATLNKYYKMACEYKETNSSIDKDKAFDDIIGAFEDLRNAMPLGDTASAIDVTLPLKYTKT